MSFNVNDAIKKAQEEYGLGKGEYFKPKEGDNRIRVLSGMEPHQSEYKGTKSFKFVAWVIDRKDGVIKPYFMPMTIANAIGGFQADPEYAFEDMPMPYDLNIQAVNAGTKEVEYTVIPARNNTPLTTAEQIALNEKMPIQEFVAKLREKEGGNAADQIRPVEKAVEPESEDDEAVPFPDEVPQFGQGKPFDPKSLED